MLVVLALAKADTKQEKIKSSNSLADDFFSSGNSVFEYSSDFAFDPFTPFPDWTTTTTRALSTTERGKSRSLTTKTTTLTTTTRSTTESSKRRKKLRKKFVSKKKTQQPVEVEVNFNGGGVARQEEIDERGNVRGEYSYTDPRGELVTIKYVADKDGFKLVEDEGKKKVEKKPRGDIDAWVQSILRRTTKRPITTSQPTTQKTSTRTVTKINSENKLIKDSQRGIKELVAGRNYAEKPRSNTINKTQKVSNLKTDDFKIQSHYATQQQNTLQPFHPVETHGTQSQYQSFKQQYQSRQQLPSHQQYSSQQQYATKQQYTTQQQTLSQQQLTDTQQYTSQQQYATQQQFTNPQQYTGQQQYNNQYQYPIQQQYSTKYSPVQEQYVGSQQVQNVHQYSTEQQYSLQQQQSRPGNAYDNAIQKQQAAHQAFLEKNRFRLSVQNSNPQRQAYSSQPQYQRQQHYQHRNPYYPQQQQQYYQPSTPFP